MHYRDALQIVIGEATRLNDEGALPDFDFEMLKGDVETINDVLSDASKRTASETDGSRNRTNASRPPAAFSDDRRDSQ